MTRALLPHSPRKADRDTYTCHTEGAGIISCAFLHFYANHAEKLHAVQHKKLFLLSFFFAGSKVCSNFVSLSKERHLHRNQLKNLTNYHEF